MAEPAELLLIKDQYEQALHCLKRGMAAEEAGSRPEALEYYRTGGKHLTQGLEVPTGGARHHGGSPCWDTARQLQQKMRDTLENLAAHIPELESAVELTTESRQRPAAAGRESVDHFYPALGHDLQPPHSTLHHLYPTVAALDTAQTTTLPAPNLLVPTPAPAPVRPASPQAIPQGTTTTTTATIPSLPGCWPPEDQPPAYTPRPTDGHHSLPAYSPASRGLGLAGQMLGGTMGGEEGGEELLLIHSGVQLFFVTPDGQVSSLSHPGFLRIISFGGRSKDSSASGRPSAVLHVCDWLYPLTADTPVLLANSGIFMFPDTMAETPGSYMGIVLSSELPVRDRDLFRDLLSQLAELRIQAPAEGTVGSEVINLAEKVPLLPPRSGTQQHVTMATEEEEKLPLPEWSEKMAQSILSGATWLSKGFVKGAEATGKVIHRGASKLRDHITPENTPTEVSPRVNKSLQAAKQATGGAVRVSQFLVNGVCTMAGFVGDNLAPHVKKHGAKLIPESMKKSKDGRASNLDAAMVVAASSVQGLTTMWSGLETGAKTVGKSVTSETVKTVRHKYGDEAGNATDTGLASAVNVGLAAYNIDHLGLRALLMKTGKKAVKTMVQQRNPEDGDGQAAAGDGEQQQEDRKDEEMK